MNIYSIDFWKGYYPDLNSHYMGRYLLFCKSIKMSKDRCLSYTEKHHIVPKSICKELEKEEYNIVEMSAREHYIAHWILMRAVKGNMIFAFHRLSYGKNNIKITSRVYEEIRINNKNELSRTLKGRVVSEETRKKLSIAASNRIITDEARANMSKAGKNKVFSEETRSKISKALKERGSVCYTPKGSKSAKMISESNTGRININYNNEKEKHVKPDELSEYLANGWKIGCKTRKDTRKRISVNNGIKTIRILEEELNKYLKDGWVRGTTQKGKRKPASSEYMKNNPDVMWRQIKMMREAYNKKHKGGVKDVCYVNTK